ncbi:hypothetical protein LEP1GSC133_3918 [Leptospira borgpetersenii serovar Pomona str. 200901868]|uniref:Uncharacterized protein n=3 Tax=Leptospira borgpetersenii TaxID=174 RepID=M6W5C7_LEPBO|nr:hypothetical protein LEP1GSC133_3918 [Leptospira borgpetersenii serovar Pomona str. 200901868]
MPLEEGTNYIFILANPDSIVRLKSKIDPFYDFQSEEIEELPFLFASPALIPRFLYSLDRISFSHKPIHFMAYLNFEEEKIFSKGERFPEPSFEIVNDTKYPIQQNPYLPIGSIPFQIVRGESNLTSIGTVKTGNFNLYQQKRNKMVSTRYLSLKDIVNPELSELEVEKK